MSYIYDKENLKMKREKLTLGKILKWVLVFFISTLSLSLFYYLIAALIFSTPMESKLKHENKVYKEQIPSLTERTKLLSDVVKSLKIRDDNIYNEIFHTHAPNIDPTSSLSYFHGMDSIPDSEYVRYTKEKIDESFARVAKTEENFKVINQILQTKSSKLPPLSSPIKNITYAQTSASIGEKVNPFYKVPVMHEGLDIITPADVPVYCTADGVVTNVKMSRKGLGNMVTVTHADGYVTQYAHLAQILVTKGRTVKLGTQIGNVGMSGNSFAPHLHYEVRKDSLVLNPVNYMFASVTAHQYLNMMIMSTCTGQSMD